MPPRSASWRGTSSSSRSSSRSRGRGRAWSTELVEEEASGAHSLKHAVDHIDNYLSACQLGITICSIGLGITAEPVLKDLFEAVLPHGRWLGIGAVTAAFALAYGLVSAFHVVLGELAPKSLAIARTRQVGLVLLPPMRIFYLATRPVVDALNFLGNAVLKPFGIPPASEAETAPHSEAELLRLIGESRAQGVLEPEEQEFATGAFTFGDRRVREAMVPRGDVRWFPTDETAAGAAAAVAESRHTRYPLCEPGEGLDAVVGVLDLRDLAPAVAADGSTPLGELGRPPLRTSEAELLDDLLERMRAERRQMAIVEDEFGTVVGAITLEDVLEQIVGDIRDEYDPEERPLAPGGDGDLRVDGSAQLRRVADELGLQLSDHQQHATVGGFVVERLGRVPEEGERLELDDVELEVERVDGSRPTRLAVRRREPS